MKKLLSVIILSTFAALSFSAVAADMSKPAKHAAKHHVKKYHHAVKHTPKHHVKRHAY